MAKTDVGKLIIIALLAYGIYTSLQANQQLVALLLFVFLIIVLRD